MCDLGVSGVGGSTPVVDNDAFARTGDPFGRLSRLADDAVPHKMPPWGARGRAFGVDLHVFWAVLDGELGKKDFLTHLRGTTVNYYVFARFDGGQSDPQKPVLAHKCVYACLFFIIKNALPQTSYLYTCMFLKKMTAPIYITYVYVCLFYKRHSYRSPLL